MIHLILLTIPFSLILCVLIFFGSISLRHLFDIFLYQILGYLITIPFFYLYYYKFFKQNHPKGVIVIQLEILVHAIYVIIASLYCNKIKNFLLVYNFLVFLAVYNFFKIAILMAIKKTYIKNYENQN
ncbi:MAG: hypothetical protein ACK4UJ_04885 [Leptonema sp. (in: bacteria)]